MSLMKLEIKKLGINGEGIGYYHRKPVFVRGCFPDEVVDVQIEKDNSTYYTAKINKILKVSKYRCKRKCENEACVSCPLIEMDYEAQLLHKTDIFTESIEKYSDLENTKIYAIQKNPIEDYRNQLKLPFCLGKRGLSLGTYLNESNYTVPIRNCYVQNEKLNEVSEKILDVLNQHKVRLFQKGKAEGVRFMLLRGFGKEYQLTLVVSSHCIPDKVYEDVQKIEEVVSIYESVITDRQPKTFFKKDIKHIYGRKKIKCEMDDFTFFLSPSAFFQLNACQASYMYQLASSYVEEGETVLDAYCGIGSLTLYLSRKAEKVIGIESNYQAIADARKNAEYNRIRNVEFVAGDAARKLSEYARKLHFNTIVVDPPRSGLSDDMIAAILRSRPEKIVYVSCNPTTLAKNLSELKLQYEVVEITPFDMFSETPLVESVSYLERK